MPKKAAFAYIIGETCGLSLVLGLVGAGLYIAVRQPITNWQDPSQQFRYILYNLTEIGIGGMLSFFLVWSVVRTIAWIVAGFFADRAGISK